MEQGKAVYVDTPTTNWQVRYSDLQERTLESECSEFVPFPEESPEPVALIVQGSNDLIGALYSCLLLGADALYPEKADQLVWEFVKGLHCVDNRLCALLLDCLENDVDIAEWFKKQNFGDPQSPIDEETFETPVVEGDPGGCDLDELYGRSRALWGYIHHKNLDFLEIIDNAGNTAIAWSRLVEGIPILGELPFDDALEFIGDLGEFALDAYTASHNVELEQKIICDLFCIAKLGCKLTFGDVFDYFRTWFDDPFNKLSTFVEMIQWITTQSFEGDSIVYMMSALQLFAVAAGSEWLGLKTKDWYLDFALAGEDDDDWMIFCDCPDSNLFIGFDSSDSLPAGVTYLPTVARSSGPLDGDTPSSVHAAAAYQGSHGLKEGILINEGFDDGRHASLRIDFPADVNVTEIQYYAQSQPFGTSPTITDIIWLEDDGGNILYSDQQTRARDGAWHLIKFFIIGDFDVRTIHISSQYLTNFQTGFINLDNVTVMANTAS